MLTTSTKTYLYGSEPGSPIYLVGRGTIGSKSLMTQVPRIPLWTMSTSWARVNRWSRLADAGSTMVSSADRFLPFARCVKVRFPVGVGGLIVFAGAAGAFLVLAGDFGELEDELDDELEDELEDTVPDELEDTVPDELEDTVPEEVRTKRNCSCPASRKRIASKIGLSRTGVTTVFALLPFRILPRSDALSVLVVGAPG